MELARLASKQQAASSKQQAASSKQQASKQLASRAPDGPHSKRGPEMEKKTLPRYPGWFSATLLGTAFFLGRMAIGWKRRFSGFFWLILDLWTSEKFRAWAENTKTQFPGARGTFGKNRAIQKNFSSKFRNCVTFSVLADRTPPRAGNREMLGFESPLA